MDRTLRDNTLEVQLPCSSGHRALTAVVKAQTSFDRLVLGIVQVDQPQPDELLCSDGYTTETLTRWCESDFERDALFTTSRRQGFAASEGSATARMSPLDEGGHSMSCFVPESMMLRNGWWLRLWRAGGPYLPEEREGAMLALKQIQARFNQPDEPDMGRLLLGSDRRLLHADPYTAARLLKQPAELDLIVKAFETIIPQRWPELKVGEGHDFAVKLDGKGVWIRFQRRAAVETARADHWYVEVRPLADNELPLVGAIEDIRIARAVAYIHDAYHDAPSLPQIAAVAKISPFHFHRLFTKAVGVSPKQYLQARQMQIARWLLRSTRMPVGEVAKYTGYSSHGHFTSTFHRMTGMSPSGYREAG